MRSHCLRWISFACVLTLSLSVSNAEETDLEGTGLAIAPKDAAFFASAIDARAAYEEFLASKLIKRLRETSYAKKLQAEIVSQWDDPPREIAQAKAMLNNPTVRDLLDLAKDVVGNEYFVYGDGDWAEFLMSAKEMQVEINNMSADREALESGAVLQKLPEILGKIKIPSMVFAARLKDPENAQLQLDTLEGLLKFGLGSQDEFKLITSRIIRDDFKGGQVLSLSIDTSIIPPEAVQDPGVGMLIEAFAGRQITFELGVKNELLAFTISESPGMIKSLGTVEGSLLDAEPMAVLKEGKFSNLRSILYTSQEFNQANWDANFGNYFSQLVAQVAPLFDPEMGLIENGEEWGSQLTADATWLDAKLAEIAPEFGASLAFDYATENGRRGYSYDWTENALVNADSLGLLKHDGNAVITIAAKQRRMLEVEEMVQYLLERGPYHIKQAVMAFEEDEEEQAEIIKVVDRVSPLLIRGWSILTEKCNNALEDNESLIAIATDWQTTTLGPELPPPSQPLPLPEIALALKVSDKDALIEAGKEMFDLFDDVVSLVREFSPDTVPEGYLVPRPDQKEVAGGTAFHYEILDQLSMVEGFAPQIALTDDVVILSYTDAQVASMLKAEEFKGLPEWLEKPEGAVVSCADLGGFITAFKPWLEFGLSLSGEEMDSPVADADGVPVPTGNEILEIFDCLEELGEVQSSVSIDEDTGASIGRWSWEAK